MKFQIQSTVKVKELKAIRGDKIGQGVHIGGLKKAWLVLLFHILNLTLMTIKALNRWT